MKNLLIAIAAAAVLVFSYANIPAHADHSSKSEKSTKSDKSNRSEKSSKSDKSNKSEKSKKSNKKKNKKSDKSKKSEKSAKSAKSDKSDKSKKSKKKKKKSKKSDKPVPTTQVCLLNTTSGTYNFANVPITDVEDLMAQNMLGPILVRFRDADSDGLGDPQSFIETCGEISGYVANGSDPDDTTPTGPIPD